jgi:hypothetical protein
MQLPPYKFARPPLSITDGRKLASIRVVIRDRHEHSFPYKIKNYAKDKHTEQHYRRCIHVLHYM